MRALSATLVYTYANNESILSNGYGASAAQQRFDRQTDGQTDRQTDGQTDGQTRIQ